MEQSGVVGLNIEGNPVRVTDFRDAPFCSQQVLVDMLGTELITPDVVRGWVGAMWSFKRWPLAFERC